MCHPCEKRPSNPLPLHSEWTNKQPCQPLQCLQISKRKRRKRDRERESERQEKAVVITLPCLSFFTHSGVERKLCVAGAGENTKQALLCERWIGCGSQRVYLCCWTITLGHTLHLWQNEGEWAREAAWVHFNITASLLVISWRWHHSKQPKSGLVLLLT